MITKVEYCKYRKLLLQVAHATCKGSFFSVRLAAHVSGELTTEEIIATFTGDAYDALIESSR